MRTLLVTLCCTLLLSSCAHQAPRVIQIPEPLEDSKSPTAVQPTPGSLWSSDSPSIYSDHKAQTIGDIVTIIISEESSASKEASTATDRETSMSAAIPNLLGLENSSFIADSNLDLENLVNSTFSNSFNGDGTTSRSGSFTASLTTQVVGHYPNGNLKIRGGKEVMVNNEVQIIYLTGIIRPIDITAANTISSTKVLNARISYTGQGAISDKQEPGWVMRTLDNIWPF